MGLTLPVGEESAIVASGKADWGLAGSFGVIGRVGERQPDVERRVQSDCGDPLAH